MIPKSYMDQVKKIIIATGRTTNEEVYTCLKPSSNTMKFTKTLKITWGNNLTEFSLSFGKHADFLLSWNILCFFAAMLDDEPKSSNMAAKSKSKIFVFSITLQEWYYLAIFRHFPWGVGLKAGFKCDFMRMKYLTTSHVIC